MKKNIFMSTVLVIALVLSTLAFAPFSAEAKNNKSQNGNAFPGNSLYGRMHNPHFMYKWGNQEFEDFDALIDHIREYLRYRFQYRFNQYDEDNEVRDVYVQTRSAIAIDEDSARLRGKIVRDAEDDEEVTVWFLYGTSATKLDEETDTITLDEDDDVLFDQTITELDDDTRYYFRAVLEDEDGNTRYGVILQFRTDDADSDDLDAPNITTLAPRDVEETSASLRGTVTMNDFDNGEVFFVFGTSEDQIDDVDNDYNTYDDIEEDGDDLMKVLVDSDLDGSEVYLEEVEDLEENTTYYYRIGLQYEDEDDDVALLFGAIREFETD